MRRSIYAALIMSFAMSTATIAGEMVHDTAHQDLTPPQSVEMYLDGFHNYVHQDHLAKDQQLQKRYAHYCKQVSPGMFQCLIYDGNTKDARLVGTEHVISQERYDKLSAAEKKYWHPHDGEVDSGMLRAPGMDPEKEKATLDFLKHTWGKTWTVWQPGDDVPVGEPKLMWAVNPKEVNDKTKEAMVKRVSDPLF